MFGYKYLYKELFILADPYDTTDYHEMYIAESINDIIAVSRRHLDKNNRNYYSAYHGFLIPITFISEKLYNLEQLYIIQLFKTVKRDDKNTDLSYCIIEASIDSIDTKKDTIQSITEKAVINNIALSEDLYIFLGYKLGSTAVVDIEDIDDQELEERKVLSEEANTIIDLIESVQDGLITEAIEGKKGLRAKYEKISNLLNYKSIENLVE